MDQNKLLNVTLARDFAILEGMKRHLFCTSFVLGVLLSGCGDLRSSLSDVSAPKKIIPEEFFYQTSGSCDDGSLNFVSLRGGGLMLWSDPEQLIVGQGALYLSKNNTFTLRYEEFNFDTKVFNAKLAGKFDFNDQTGEMKLEGVGVGSLITFKGRSALEFQFTKAINEPSLKDKKTIFNIVRSAEGLDTTRPDYCNY